MVWTLPDLAYDYGALEPHVSAKIMELHHGKHHAAYVEAANDAVDKLAEARSSGDLASVNALEADLAFNVSGHVLHSLFWNCMTPDSGEAPKGKLEAAITNDFGSFDALKGELATATVKVQGSGWGALVWEPLADRLLVAQFHDHQHQAIQGTIPILVIDAWEHAYYLQYQNDRAGFVEAFWNIADWRSAEVRYRDAYAALSPKVETTS